MRIDHNRQMIITWSQLTLMIQWLFKNQINLAAKKIKNRFTDPMMWKLLPCNNVTIVLNDAVFG